MSPEQTASQFRATTLSSNAEQSAVHNQPLAAVRKPWPNRRHPGLELVIHNHKRQCHEKPAVPTEPSPVLGSVVLAPVFHRVSLADCTEIALFARPRTFSPRQVIFREEDPVRSVFVTSSGRVKMSQVSSRGKQVILRVDGPGSLLDGVTLCAGTSHSMTAESLESCELLAWDIQTFQRFTRDIPLILRNYTNIVAERLRALEKRFRELATERVPQRLARTLIRFLSQSGRPTQSVPIGLSCEELAQMIGTTLFSVSRLLCEWAAMGIIYAERKTIFVESLPALMALAEGEEDSV